MKILFGVQATGNGHITRARAMNKQFKALGLDVDYLFSGREKSHFFDMEEFGDWRCFRGLTFYHEAGDLKIFRTIQKNSILQMYKDINALDLSPYDIILTDYEPITAWACKKAKRECIGLGHQYAFNFDVPRRGDSFIPKLIMKNFAPVSTSLGLHWHHFNQNILPPIAETHQSTEVSDPNKIVVYLGFESPEEVISLLEPFESHLFVFYGPFPQYESRGHIQLKPLSREGFKQDLATAGGVICNAGFELSSEAIQLGKKLLIKPLKGQIEQLSNARALEELGLGLTMETLDPARVKDWLDNWEGKQVIYPNVAKAIAQWVANGDWEKPESRAELAKTLWSQTRANGVKSFETNPTPESVKPCPPDEAVA
ncbi:MAG: glycosyltransferase [Agarilytica sp.]